MRSIITILFFLMSGSVFGLCVQTEFANLRSGPSTSFEQTWKVFRYMPLKKLDKKNGWYRVQDVDGREHWIREDLVTSSYRCAVIKNEWAYLRTGPGRHYPKKPAEKGLKYLSFRLLETKNGWAHLEDAQGDELWVHLPLLWLGEDRAQDT